MSKDRSTFKKNLLSSLTEREMAGFVELLKIMRKPSGENMKYLMGFDTKTLFGFLHQKLFGEWDLSVLGFQRVMENLDGVRALLGSTPIRVACFKHAFPKMPSNLQISNEWAQNIFVMFHAWKRFCERFQERTKKLHPDEVAACLQQSFSKAKPVKLDNSHAVMRIIHNKFTSVDYFIDQSMRCRFVVGLLNGRPSLFTVERPYPRL